MKLKLSHYIRCVIILSGLAGFSEIAAQQLSKTFGYTGAMQTFTVPPCVSVLSIEAFGASGQSVTTSGVVNRGGWGGRVRAVYPVTPGQVLYLFVGGTDGYNGGGNGALYGGNGGGATDVRIGDTALTGRILVAGGGGGAGSNCMVSANYGGHGGDTIGEMGWNCGQQIWWVGTGGTQTGGGMSLGNMAMPGTFGIGGDGGNNEGGGGGGGYYGGGGGGYGGGGGGSNYANATALQVATNRGMRIGHGQLSIYYSEDGTKPPVLAACIRTLICRHETVTLTATGASSYTWSTAQTGSQIAVSPTLHTYYTVTGVAPNTGCTSTATVYVKVLSCVGIEENERENESERNYLTIYPNPSGGAFVIAAQQRTDIIVYNQLGQVLRKYSLNDSNNFTLTENALESGVYFISEEKGREPGSYKTLCKKVVITK
jgi:hypothetical protein